MDNSPVPELKRRADESAKSPPVEANGIRPEVNPESVKLVPETAPVEATEEGVIAPSVSVMTGVVVAFATLPDTPLAELTDTFVTVPDPPPPPPGETDPAEILDPRLAVAVWAIATQAKVNDRSVLKNSFMC